MSNEKRVLKINEDLFKFPDRKSRKKYDKDAPKIKIKSSISNAKNKTLRRSVLNLIRKKQEEEYEKIFNNKDTNKKQPTASKSSEDNFNKDFKESFDYLSSLVEKTNNEETQKTEAASHNNTFKRYPNEMPNSILLQPDTNLFINTNENVSNELPLELLNNLEGEQLHINIKSRTHLPPPPKYGCLKNGSLPTYRNWYNHTQRALPSSESVITENSNNHSYHPPVLKTVISQRYPEIPQERHIVDTQNIINNTTKMEKEFLENRRKNEMLQTYEKTTSKKEQGKIKYLKRKKIYKRTYRVGKSKIAPKVGVLVSNKTIRCKINTEAQKLKLVPMNEIRKFLIKRGLIKVGSNAPEHILRKMYESMFLICGEVQNHNPENLLYNFINDTDQ